MRPAVQVFDPILFEVALVYTVEAFDFGIALVLESFPVEGGSGLDGEAVRGGFVDRFCDGSRVPGYLLGDATRGLLEVHCTVCEYLRGTVPNIYAGSSKAVALYGYRLCSVGATCPAS